MDRRIAGVVLLFVLTLSTLTLATHAASGPATASARVPAPSMSGEFAHTHFA